MQAILILAHKNEEQIYLLAERLRLQFLVYIHFDKKYNLSAQYEYKIKSLPNVFLIERINVQWGGWSIVQATINLMDAALKNPCVDYVHVISGQCWPVCDVGEIYDFFNDNEKIYINYQLADGICKSYEPITFWQKYYFNYDSLNRKSLFGKFYHRVLIIFQTIFRVNKLKKFNINMPLYTGSNWVSMPRYAVEYCLEFLKENTNYLNLFRTGFCSDEFWIQTILCNSIYFNRIENNNYRYINWIKKYDNYPAILDENDYESISNEKYFWARKIDINISNKLIELLK